jgi:hypothetical protein
MIKDVIHSLLALPPTGSKNVPDVRHLLETDFWPALLSCVASTTGLAVIREWLRSSNALVVIDSKARWLMAVRAPKAAGDYTLAVLFGLCNKSPRADGRY